MAPRFRGHKQKKVNGHVYSFIWFVSSRPHYQLNFNTSKVAHSRFPSGHFLCNFTNPNHVCQYVTSQNKQCTVVCNEIWLKCTLHEWKTLRDRSLITSQGGGGFQKSVVFQNWTPSKNLEVKIIPPFSILVWKTSPPPPLLVDVLLGKLARDEDA